MDFQRNVRDPTKEYANSTPGTPPTVGAHEGFTVRPGMPQVPFFQGFHHMGNQMPYLFPHPFMPASPGPAFTSPTRVIPNATIDLTEDIKKRAPQECVTEQSNPTKRQRGKGKKPVIVDLDDAKDDVELIKTAGHWKDHRVIQLISIRGKMQNIFSAPPYQGISFP